jgi:hypothetical protein
MCRRRVGVGGWWLAVVVADELIRKAVPRSGDNLESMEGSVERAVRDRRARARGGRRNGDGQKPWYLRQPLLLTIASLMFVGWQRVRRR